MHNEDFYANSNFREIVSKLKPRLSYGVNGNIDVLSNYGVFGSYGQQGIYNGQTGYANSLLPTLDLRWERATTFNVGIDIGLFNDRVSILADVYSRDIIDKLANLTLPYYTGTQDSFVRKPLRCIQVSCPATDQRLYMCTNAAAHMVRFRTRPISRRLAQVVRLG